ncbi:MAG: DNA-binding protein [Planctomycetota bacterium]
MTQIQLSEVEERPKRWMSVSDLCQFFECSRTTLHRMRTDPNGGFPEPIQRRTGAHPRWRRDDIEKYESQLGAGR